jgi:hypothetical protein
LLLAFGSAVILMFDSRGTGDNILLSQIRDSPTWKVRSRIYIPQEQGGPVYPQAPGSLFVASYDSLGYGGEIRSGLHMGFQMGFRCSKLKEFFLLGDKAV